MREDPTITKTKTIFNVDDNLNLNWSVFDLKIVQKSTGKSIKTIKKR